MVTRREARTLLASDTEVSYDALEEIFRAFGFHSEFEAPDVWTYYHPDFDCGIFRARDRYGWGIISPGQRSIIRYMVSCVAVNERRKYGHELQDNPG